jgi:hypothetical protein
LDEHEFQLEPKLNELVAVWDPINLRPSNLRQASKACSNLCLLVGHLLYRYLFENAAGCLKFRE